MISWYISKDRKKDGPLSEDQLVKRIKAGEFGKGALVWKKGMSTWEPLELHFDTTIEISPITHPISLVSAETEKLPELPVLEQPANSKKKSGPTILKKYAPLRWHFAATVILFFIFICIHKSDSQIGNITIHAIVWGGSLLAAIASAVILLRKMWRLACLGNGEHSHGGGEKLAVLFGGVILAMFTLIYVSQASLIYRVDQARRAYDKYTMEVDVASDSITINGTIGPTFSDRLDDYLSIHAGIDTIIITSPGGLVDQAIKAAKIIEKHGKISVIARESCNSACLIILMSGDKRYADWDMGLGFHATSAITNVDPEHLSLVSLSAEADGYLTKRGVPKEILDHGFSKGGKSLDMVPAIKLAESNSLTGLLDKDKKITVNEAKWRIVESAVAGLSDKNISGFSDVLKAIRETSPDVVNNNAEELYKAYESLDPVQIKNSVRAIVSVVTPKAMQAADGKALYAYANNNLKQIEYLLNMEDWNACANYIDGKVGAEINVMSQDLLHDEFASLEKVIRSASSKKWKVQPIPQWSKQRGEAIAQTTALELLKRGIDMDKFDKDSKTKCAFTYVLVKTMIDEGVDRAPPILRWMNSLADSTESVNTVASAQKKKMFSFNQLEAQPSRYDSGIGGLYRIIGANTAPLLYSPTLDRMVNPDCPNEDMSGTIRNQIGFGCIEQPHAPTASAFSQ